MRRPRPRLIVVVIAVALVLMLPAAAPASDPQVARTLDRDADPVVATGGLSPRTRTISVENDGTGALAWTATEAIRGSG